ncbi:MAG: ribonuclease P protein component [Pseudomonadota bacterium]
MLPATGYPFRKDQRLLDQAAYGRVFKKARRSRDKCFTVLARRNTEASARLGLAISKKHCRKASARNRIKRMVRESFRLHQAELEGLDVVVLNQPAAALASNRELLDSLDAHWRRSVAASRPGNKD